MDVLYPGIRISFSRGWITIFIEDMPDIMKSKVSFVKVFSIADKILKICMHYRLSKLVMYSVSLIIGGLPTLAIFLALITSLNVNAQQGNESLCPSNRIVSWGGPSDVNVNRTFNSPSSLSVDPENNFVYITDLGNNRVMKLDSDGKPDTTWGSAGSGDGQFHHPGDIDVDPTRQFVYVTDIDNNRIQKFDSNGKFISTWGSAGPAEGQFDKPGGISINPVNGHIYVADTSNDRIQVFDNEGRLISIIGESGSKNGQFSRPDGINFDRSGTLLYVADRLNSRIQIFDPEGNFKGKITANPDLKILFAKPRDVDVDTSKMFIVDKDANMIQIVPLIGSAGTNGTTNSLNVTSIDASAFETEFGDTHRPADAMDNDPSTWWSNQAIPSWIQGAIGGEKTLCGVDIIWNKGTDRVYAFTISVSSDGKYFSPVYKDKSRQTESVERYNFPATQANFIRITIDDSSSSRKWVSIKEIAYLGGNVPILPVAYPLEIETQQNIQLPFTLKAEDKNNVPLTYSVESQPENGNILQTQGSSSKMIYIPNKDYTGQDQFTYKVNDGKADSNPATVLITIKPPIKLPPLNKPPVAVDLQVETQQNKPLPFTLSAKDENNDPLTYSIISEPINGKLNYAQGSSNKGTYVPNKDYTGQDQFTYKVNDGKDDSSLATVLITIKGDTTNYIMYGLIAAVVAGAGIAGAFIYRRHRAGGIIDVP